MKYKHLSLEERETIRVGLETGKSKRKIGRELGRSHTSIIREIKRNCICKTPDKGYGHFVVNCRKRTLTDFCCS